MNIFNLFESPKLGAPSNTPGAQDIGDQHSPSPIGSGTSKREAKKKPVTMMGVGVKESKITEIWEPLLEGQMPNFLDDDFYAYDPETREIKSTWSHKSVGRRHSEYQAQQQGWSVVSGMKARSLGLHYPEKKVDEAGPFSYGTKKPRKGSVADLAAKKRKEQERGQQTIEPKDQRVGVAKVVKEFAPSGGGGRWYSDDQLYEIIGEDWLEAFDVSGDQGNIDLNGERARLFLAQEAEAWLTDRGYRVNVLDVRDDGDSLSWYIQGPLYQGLAEGQDDNGISFQIQKGKNKFATTLSIGNNPVGVYQYDANTGRSIAEVYPEFKGKGLGKLLVLHAIYTAAQLGLDFQEDESRTAEYDNVLDSLSSNGYIVDDDGYWYVTGEGEQYLQQSMKQGVAEGKHQNQQVVNAIQKVLPVAQEIWFHGSRATGQHRRNSDTDILVVVPDELVGDQYLGVVRILQKLSSHFDNYDIQPTKSGTNIHQIAQEEGKLLWSTTNENFADGKVKGKSRPGRVKRSGASCSGSVTDLRARAKRYGGEKGKMYHWCANMKGGRQK